MADNTAENNVGDIDVGVIVAAGLGQADALNAKGLAEFDHLFENSALSEQERLEFLQNVWNIIVSLIDFAWGEHSLQFTLKDSGKLAKIDRKQGLQGDGMVQLENRNLTKHYKKVAE